MPQTKSAKKSLRNQRRKQLINRPIKKSLKQILSLARSKPSAENLKKAIVAVDRAAAKKIIPKRRASRLKSRLSRRSPRP